MKDLKDLIEENTGTITEGTRIFDMDDVMNILQEFTNNLKIVQKNPIPMIENPLEDYIDFQLIRAKEYLKS